MKGRFLSGYRPGKPGLEKVLGSLESEIMEVVWQKAGEVSVRDVLDALTAQREIAYTTVMTIMGRLAAKKLLQKRKIGNAFYFTPALTRDEFTGQMVGGMIDDLLAEFSDAAMNHFVRRVEEKDRAVLDKLERALSEARERDNDHSVE